MPLYGKIVVIKRNGSDGTHFPLTASSCLFGRKTECDIRIQLPHVSKEHCKIEVNENKEAIVTNLSSVNPTQLNGVCIQQPVALLHGDILTVIDRSFRFEYPSQSTPRRKRNSTALNNETLQQVAEIEPLRTRRQGSSVITVSDDGAGSEGDAEENTGSTGQISGGLPTKLLSSTVKTTHRRSKSFKEHDQSPFSELYEMLKHHIDIKPKQQDDEKGKDFAEAHDQRNVGNILRENTGSQTPSSSRRRSGRKSQTNSTDVHTPLENVEESSFDFSSEVRVSARSPLRSGLSASSYQYPGLDITPKFGYRDERGSNVSSPNAKILDFSETEQHKTKITRMSDFKVGSVGMLIDQSSPEETKMSSTREESVTVCSQPGKTITEVQTVRYEDFILEDHGAKENSGKLEEGSKRLSQRRSLSAQQVVLEIQDELYSNVSGSSQRNNRSLDVSESPKVLANTVTQRGRSSLHQTPKSTKYTSVLPSPNTYPRQSTPLGQESGKESLSTPDSLTEQKSITPKRGRTSRGEAAKSLSVSSSRRSYSLSELSGRQSMDVSSHPGNEVDILQLSFETQESSDQKLSSQKQRGRPSMKTTKSSTSTNSENYSRRLSLSKEQENSLEQTKAAETPEMSENKPKGRRSVHLDTKPLATPEQERKPRSVSLGNTSVFSELHVEKTTKFDHSPPKRGRFVKGQTPKSTSKSPIRTSRKSTEQKSVPLTPKGSPSVTQTPESGDGHAEQKSSSATRRGRPRIHSPKQTSLLPPSSSLSLQSTPMHTPQRGRPRKTPKSSSLSPHPESSHSDDAMKTKDSTLPESQNSLVKRGRGRPSKGSTSVSPYRASPKSVGASDNLVVLSTLVSGSESRRSLAGRTPKSVPTEEPSTPAPSSEQSFSLTRRGKTPTTVSPHRLHALHSTPVFSSESGENVVSEKKRGRPSKAKTPKSAVSPHSSESVDPTSSPTSVSPHRTRTPMSVQSTAVDTAITPEKSLLAQRGIKSTDQINTPSSLPHRVSSPRQNASLRSSSDGVDTAELQTPSPRPRGRPRKADTPKSPDHKITPLEMQSTPMTIETKATLLSEERTYSAKSKCQRFGESLVLNHNPSPKRSPVRSSEALFSYGEENVFSVTRKGRQSIALTPKSISSPPIGSPLSVQSVPVNMNSAEQNVSSAARRDRTSMQKTPKLNSVSPPHRSSPRTSGNPLTEQKLPSPKRSSPVRTPKSASVSPIRGSSSLGAHTSFDVPETSATKKSSPARRRSGAAVHQDGNVVTASEEDSSSAAKSKRVSPRRQSGRVHTSEVEEAKKSPKKRRSGELDPLPEPPMKRKRVSFGGHLSPELFDKRLPPNSPLRKGATPARLSLQFSNTPRAVIRKSFGIRHAVIQERSDKRSPNASPAKLSPSKKSPVKSPVKRSPPRKSLATSPVQRSPSKKTPVTSLASKSPSKSAATLPTSKSPLGSPANLSPASKSPRRNAATVSTNTSLTKESSSSRGSPATSPALGRASARGSPATSPAPGRASARGSPATSPAPGRASARGSPATSPAPGRASGRGSPASSPEPTRSSAMVSPASSPAPGRSSARVSPASSSAPGRSSARVSPATSPAPGRASARVSPATSPAPGRASARVSPATSPALRRASARGSPATSPAPGRSSARGSPATSPAPGRASARGSLAASPALGRSSVGGSPATSPVLRMSSRRGSPAVVGAEVETISMSPASTPVQTRIGRTPSRGAAPSPAGRTPSRGAAPSPAGRTPSRGALMSTSPKIRYSSGRFSVSRITTPTSQRDTGTEISQKEIVVQKPENDGYQAAQESEDKYPPKSVERRKTPSRRKSRSDAFEAFRSRRKSGATEANLLVAKSWADIVKLGVARTPVKNVKHGVRVKVTKKKLTKSKTPARKVKGHVGTGHADSPATIVIGRAHSRTIPLAGRTPRVVKNYSLIQRVDVNESFTGMTEMFTTPKGENKASLTPAKAPAEELSVMLTPEESGEMIVSPLSTTPVTKKHKQYSQDAVSRFLRGNETQSSSQPKLQRMSKGKSPKGANLESGKETYKTPQSSRSRSSKVDVTESTILNDFVGLRRLMKTPREKAKSVLDAVALKRLLRTPRPKRQSVVDELAAVAKSRSEKSDLDLVGIKRLMKTPKEKGQEVFDMVGVSRIMKTPKQKGKLIESNLGIRRLMRTPKEYSIHAKKRLGQKVQPVEDMIGISRIMKTPKNKMQPVEDLMGIKRLMASPKQKSSPLEDLRGISRLLRTPKERVVPLVRASTRIKPTLSDSELNYSGIKELFDTPKESKLKSTKDLTGSSTVQETTEENELLPHPQSKMLSSRKNPEKGTLKVEDKNDKTPGRLRRKLETCHTNKSLSVETENVGTSLTESKLLSDKIDSPPKRRGRPPRGSVEPLSSTDKDSSISKNEELAAELRKAFGKATTTVARRLKKPPVKETAKAPVRLGRSLRNTDVPIVSELVKIITPSKLQQRQPAQNRKGKVMESLPTEKAPTLLAMPVSLLNKVTKKAVLKRGKGRSRGAPKGLSGQDTSEDLSLKNVKASNLLQNVAVVDQVVAGVAPIKLGRGKRDTDVKNVPASPRTHGKKDESPVEVKDAERPTRGRNKALLMENTEPTEMLPLTRRLRTQAPSAGKGLQSLEKSIPNNSEQQTNSLEKPSIRAKVKKSVKWHPLVTDVMPSEPESAKETQTQLPNVLMVSSERPAVEVKDPLIPARKSRGRVASSNPPTSVQELVAEKQTKIAKSVLIEMATNTSTKEAAVEVSELITQRRGRRNKLETLHRSVSDSTAAEVLAGGSQTAETQAEQTVGENSNRRRTARGKQANKTTLSKESTQSTNELLVEKDAAEKPKGLKMQKTVSASPRGRRKNEVSAISDFEKSIQEQKEHLTADVAIESTNVENQNAEDKQAVGEKSRSKTARSRRTKGVLAEEKPDEVSNGIAVKDKELEVPPSVILNPRRGRRKLEHLPSSVSLSDSVSNSIGSDSSEVSCVGDGLVAETLAEETLAEETLAEETVAEETVAEKFSSKRKTARGKQPKPVIQMSPPKASVSSNIKTSLDKYSAQKQSVKDDEITLENSKGPELMSIAATPRRGKNKQSTVNESFTTLSKLNEANTVNVQIAESNIVTKKRLVGRKPVTDNTSSQSLASAIANTSTLSDLESTMLLDKTSMANEKSSRRIGRGRATNQSNHIAGDGENLPEDQLIICKKSFKRTKTTTVVVPARAGRRGQAGVLPETDEAPSEDQRRGVKRKLTGKEVATLLVNETEKQPESSPTKTFLRASRQSKALGTAVDASDGDQKKDVVPDGPVKNMSETFVKEQNVLSTKTRGKARKVEPKSPEVPSPVKEIAKKRGKPKVDYEPQPALILTESNTSPKKAKMEVGDTLLKARGLRKEKRRPSNERKVTPDVEMKRTRARTRK